MLLVRSGTSISPATALTAWTCGQPSSPVSGPLGSGPGFLFFASVSLEILRALYIYVGKGVVPWETPGRVYTWSAHQGAIYLIAACAISIRARGLNHMKSACQT